MGLEPTRCCQRQILSLMRLPFRHSCALFNYHLLTGIYVTTSRSILQAFIFVWSLLDSTHKISSSLAKIFLYMLAFLYIWALRHIFVIPLPIFIRTLNILTHYLDTDKQTLLALPNRTIYKWISGHCYNYYILTAQPCYLQVNFWALSQFPRSHCPAILHPK